MDRPGIIQSFMAPTILNRQLRDTTKPTNLLFQNDNGQWLIRVQRPGIAQPLIAPSKAGSGVQGFGNFGWAPKAGCPGHCFRSYFNHSDPRCYGSPQGETPCLPKPAFRYSR